MTKWLAIPCSKSYCFKAACALFIGVVFKAQLLWADSSGEPLMPFAKKPIVVATIKPIALMVNSLAGDNFDVVTLLPPNANPHALAMTISDRQHLEDAGLVIWLGDNFERFLSKPMAQRRSPKLELGKLANLKWPNKQGGDLHLWLDPYNVELALVAIGRELKALSPLLAPVIDLRLSNALIAIRQTQANIHQRLLPYHKVPFAVSHDGYGHFVNAFGLMQLEAATQLPEQQLSARRMYELQQSVAQARCLIVEPEGGSSLKLAQTFNLDAVVADPLGRAENIDSIDKLFQALAASFIECLGGPASE